MVLAHGGRNLSNETSADWGASPHCQAVLVRVGHRASLTAFPHPPQASHGAPSQLLMSLPMSTTWSTCRTGALIIPSVSDPALREPFCPPDWATSTLSNSWGPSPSWTV